MLDIIYVCWCMCISIAAAAVLWLLLKVIESITFRGNILHLPSSLHSAHHLLCCCVEIVLSAVLPTVCMLMWMECIIYSAGVVFLMPAS